MSDLDLSEKTSDIDMKFMRKKRQNDLSSNFLFRKFLTGKIYGEYENLSNKFSSLFSFDWDDEKIVKPIYHPSNYLLN